MKDSYVLRLPYEKTNSGDQFAFNDSDIKKIKAIAKRSGWSLRKFITFKIKEIIREG